MLIQPKRNKSKGFNNKKTFVSITTITFNRYKFLNILKSHILNQTYPQHLIEWVIIDDSTDEIDKEIINDSRLNIKYTKLTEKTFIGRKRNIANSKSKGEIILVMDDDDFYPVNRISHAVDALQNSKKLIAGSTYLPIFYLPEKEFWMAGPYKGNHATAATFAYKKELLNITKFNNESKTAEEKEFLNGYKIPMIQLDPFSTIICIAHKSNTYDKGHMRLDPKKHKLKRINNNKSIIDEIYECYKKLI